MVTTMSISTDVVTILPDENTGDILIRETLTGQLITRVSDVELLGVSILRATELAEEEYRRRAADAASDMRYDYDYDDYYGYDY